MQITAEQAVVIVPGITARMNSSEWVAVDLSYLADPIAFTPEVIASEKRRLPEWRWQKEYERNFHAQAGQSVIDAEWLRWQDPHICNPLYTLSWDPKTKELARVTDGAPGAVQVWIHPDSQPPNRPEHMVKTVRSFAIGIDVAEGVGASDSAITGIVADTKETAFEFKSNRITPTELGHLAAALGRMFNMALILCVRKMHGLTTIREMADVEGYPLLWHDRVLDRVVQITTDKLGWQGAEASDQNLFGPWRKAWEEHLVICHSAEMQLQGSQYIFDDMGWIVHQRNVDLPMAARARHGDVFISGALAWRAVCDVPLFKAQVPEDVAPYRSLNWRDEEIKKREYEIQNKEDSRWL